MKEKLLMLGNQAIARGAFEAGVKVSSAYPGTPSTEISEFLAKYPEVYAEWAPNEKVALEVAIGASFSGVRSLCCMKHVGLNVASDPLYTFAYTGVNGGSVIVVADQDDSAFGARASFRAFGQRGGEGFHEICFRTLRKIRHSRHFKDYYKVVAFPKRGKYRGESRPAR